jgi:hypothetical protein
MGDMHVDLLLLSNVISYFIRIGSNMTVRAISLLNFKIESVMDFKGRVKGGTYN